MIRIDFISRVNQFAMQYMRVILILFVTDRRLRFIVRDIKITETVNNYCEQYSTLEKFKTIKECYTSFPWCMMHSLRFINCSISSLYFS